MTILSVTQQAIMQLVGRKPAAVVSSTEPICVEMTAMAMEAAADIARAHDWQKLTEIYTLTANGTDSAYPFPSDYDRMVQASEVFDPANWCWGYHHVVDVSTWIQYQISGIGLISPGVWTIRNDQFQFLPKPASGQQAMFPYISKNLFRDASGNRKSEITQDSDTFVLDENVLKLAIIWRWLSLKRMDYQQEMADYNDAISERAAKDQGARVIRGRRLGNRLNLRPAYPWTLGGV